MDGEPIDIPDTDKLWVGGDFNGHCGRNHNVKEETIGTCGVGESNEAGYNCVAFAMSHNMRMVNTRLNTRVEQQSHSLITFCAEAVTRVTLKTAKLSWVKV